MRPSVVYGVTLTALMIGAYLTWTHEDAAAEAAEVIVVDAKTEDIQRIVYTSEKLDLDLEARKDDRGSFLWVKSEERRKKRKSSKPDDGHGHGDEAGEDHGDEPGDAGTEGADGEGADGEGADGEAVKEEVEEIELISKSFKAGDAGDKLLETFSPLEATRLIEVAADKLADFGLDEPTEYLEIQRQGKDTRTFDLGGEAYGTKDRYIRDRASEKVYLVSADALNPLKRGATSLPDRALMGLEESDALQVQVNSAADTLTLEHRNRDDEDASHWRVIGDEEPNESAGTWLEKIFRLRSAFYVQADEAPINQELMFAVTVTAEDSSTEVLEVFKGDSPSGDVAWYARSPYTRELVQLHTSPASQAAEDLTTILE